MNSIPSSKGTAAVVALVIAVAAVGTAAAVTMTTNTAPEEAQVGDEVTVSVTLSDLYSEDNQWTLSGTTALDNVTGWEVTKVRPAGNTTEQFTGQESFEMQVDRSDNVTDIVATITGDAPSIESFDYRDPQSFAAAEFTRIVGNSETTIDTVSVHHYTNESREARLAIDDAQRAVDKADSADAESDLDDAINDYDQGDFTRAIENADEAKRTANDAKQSEETMQLLLYGVAAVVLLVLLGGGVYYYRNQQDSYDKLR